MLFSVIFSSEEGNSTTTKPSPLAKVKPEKKQNKYEHVKINVMKKIALYINPLIYVIFCSLYFVFYLSIF